MAYIEFKDVSKIYKSGEIEVKALDKVNFEIEQGELVCILGHSGAGKTTALNILGGMDKATSGKITVAKKDITKYNKKDLIKYRRTNIGFVFQFYNLIQNLTALENVELATEICKNSLSPKETLINVGLKDRLNNFPAQLSGGEQQRVSLARAIVNNPTVLIADEPTGNLDPETAKEIMDLLNDINTAGTTIVMATHAKDIVDTMKKRVIAIESGNIVRDDTRGMYENED